MRIVKLVFAISVLSLISFNIFAANDKQWSVTVVNDTKTPVYVTELEHSGAPVYWQTSQLEPGQSEVFKTSATDSVDDMAFRFVSGAIMDAKGFYCYRDGRASTLYTGKSDIYPMTISLSGVLNNTTCNEEPKTIKALTSHPE